MHTEKVVIITGAAGGIGSAIARKFAKNKFHITLSDINADALQEVADDLTVNYGIECLLCVGDLAATVYLNDIVKKTIQKWNRIDVLVNNAAWRKIESMRNTDLITWERTLSICLTAPAFLSKWVALEMEKRNINGVIINMSSIMSERPSGTSAAYIASKSALDGLSRELAVTYGRSGIRVVSVCPGYIDTDLSNDYVNKEGDNISSLISTEFKDCLPIARSGKPDEVAEAVYWISSECASYITGTSIVIDGGFRSNFNKYSLKKLQFPEEF